jgi:hypothetical protein
MILYNHSGCQQPHSWHVGELQAGSSFLQYHAVVTLKVSFEGKTDLNGQVRINKQLAATSIALS